MPATKRASKKSATKKTAATKPAAKKSAAKKTAERKTASKGSAAGLGETLAALRALLEAQVRASKGALRITQDGPKGLQVEMSTREFRGKPLYFGGVAARASYVSFYLFPVYMFPDLLDGMTPELRKRTQGKSCFNFKRVDPALFKELAAVTKKGLAAVAKRALPLA